MNDVQEELTVRAMARKKFGRKKTLKSKVHPHYKANLEREYERLMDAYMKIVSETMEEVLDEIFATPLASNFNPVGGFREDARLDDLMAFIRHAFEKANAKADTATDAFALDRKLNKLAQSARTMNADEWARVVHQTLGIDIFKDYYHGEYYRDMSDIWVHDNVDLIKTIPHDLLGDMEEIVMTGWREGRYPRDMIDEIRHHYSMTRKHARFIARDQMAKLNSDISEQQMKDAGVEEYEWSTSGDGRVRESHKALDGTIHRWDDPPVVDPKTGRREHPGKDYQCRCVALPIFDIETLNLPIKQSAQTKGEQK